MTGMSGTQPNRFHPQVPKLLTSRKNAKWLVEGGIHMRRRIAATVILLVGTLSFLPVLGKGESSLNTTLIGRWGGGFCFAVAVSDSIAFFGNGAYLVSADISNPSDVFEINRILFNGYVEDIAYSNGILFVIDNKSGLRLIDVSNPHNPEEISVFPLTAIGQDVTVVGDIAYLANWTGGLRLIDVSNPNAPTEIGSYSVLNRATSVAVQNNLALVTDASIGLQIIDIVNPQSPVFITQIVSENTCYDVEISDRNQLYLQSVGIPIAEINRPGYRLVMGKVEIEFILSGWHSINAHRG